MMLFHLVGGNNPMDTDGGALNSPVFSLDTETTGLEWTAKVVMVSMAWMGQDGISSCCLIPDTHDEPGMVSLGTVSPEFIQALFDTRKAVLHNLPFDYRMMYHLIGLLPGPSMHDTMHLAKQIEWNYELSLASLYRKYVGDVPDWVIESKEHRKTFLRIPLDTRIRYSLWDATATLELYLQLRELAPKTIDPNLYRRDLRFTQLVMRMIASGIKVDQDYTERQMAKFALQIDALAEQYKAEGVQNLNSDDQVRKLLFEDHGLSSDNLPRTDKGDKVSLAAEVMELLSEIYEDVPVMRDVVTYRQLRKCNNDWLSDFLEISAEDGRVHSEIHPFGTRSFRMTAKKPNMLALPMEDRGRAFGDLLGVFTAADPERQLWGLDLKQAEVRLGAMLAQEDRLAEVFQKGTDPYVEMALAIWGETNKELRRKAKAAMLAGLYEIGPRTFSQKHKVSQADAKQILDDFRGRFPNIKAASRFYADFAERNKYSPLHDGRRVYFADDDAFYKAFNQRVQGGVAEIMQPAMLEIDGYFGNNLLKLQIHDAVILELARDKRKRDEEVAIIGQIMADSVPQALYAMTNPKIPFIVDTKPWELVEEVA